MKKVLLFADPGIDDSFAIMFALLNPDIEIVGFVSGYGNVPEEQALQNAAYLFALAGKSNIPIISGAKGPLMGERATFYPEIHGPQGLGPIVPPSAFPFQVYGYDLVFDIINKYRKDLTIVVLGRCTSLAIGFLMAGNEWMNMAGEIIVMGGAFLVPGNVTPIAEANFYGDPVAANIIMEDGKNVTVIPLNVTNNALITLDVTTYIARQQQNPFAPILIPLNEYYINAYKELMPGIQGAPLHDVLAVMAVTNPELFLFSYRKVRVYPEVYCRGLSIADFRPGSQPEPSLNTEKIALEFNYPSFVRQYVEVMTSKM